MNNNKTKSLFVTVALVVGMLATYVSAFAYSDVGADHWAKVYVDNLSAKGYITGYEDGSFQPGADITRAEFATMLTKVFNLTTETDRTLVDVPATAWYASAVKKAVAAGFITGYEDETVRPENNITRQEAAVMVYRAWGLSPEGTVTFADGNDIADWAKNQVSTLAAKKIINGYEDGTFLPNNPITRAEIAKVLYAAIEMKAPSTDGSNPGGTTTGPLIIPNGGGSSSSGSSGSGSRRTPSPKPTKDPTPTATPKPTATPTPTATPVPTPGVEIAEPVGAGVDVKVELGDTVAATELVTVDLDLGAEVDATKAVVSFVKDSLLRTASANSNRRTATVEEFKEIKFTPAELAKADISVFITSTALTGDVTGKESVTVPVKVTVKNAEGEAVQEKTQNVVVKTQEDRVVSSLKAYQSGLDLYPKEQLAIIMLNLSDVTEANTAAIAAWCEANEAAIPAYEDVIAEVVASPTFKNLKISSNLEADYAVKYIMTMKEVVDAVALEAVKMADSDTLTRANALAYFNDTVVGMIKTGNSAYDAELVTIAKSMAVRYAEKDIIDAIIAAVKAADTEAAKVAAVFGVYASVK